MIRPITFFVRISMLVKAIEMTMRWLMERPPLVKSFTNVAASTIWIDNLAETNGSTHFMMFFNFFDFSNTNYFT